MSVKVYDAYLYDKTEEELLVELNAIRDAFFKYLKKDIEGDPSKWMRWGRELVDGKDTEEDSLRQAVRYIRKGFTAMERGYPLDVAANCVVVKHDGKIVLWLFPGYSFEKFAKENEILQRIVKNEYWWTDSADCEFDTPEEEEEYNKRGEFWKEVFERSDTGIPARLGLSFDFFSESDVFKLGDFLHMKYGAWLKKQGPAIERIRNIRVITLPEDGQLQGYFGEQVYLKADIGRFVEDVREQIKDREEAVEKMQEEVARQLASDAAKRSASERALWQARMLSAKHAAAMWFVYSSLRHATYTVDGARMDESCNSKRRRLHTPAEWVAIWDRVELRCKAKWESLR